jgi:hypothetical protein
MDGSSLDRDRLKALVMAQWRRGGMETLVKVTPKEIRPAPDRVAGYCTSFKFVAGRTPGEMEGILGFAPGTKLALGAEIFLVRPLPTAAQFELRGYSQLPGGVATNDPAYRAHPAYPPGLGAPQWELTGYPQSGLRHIATVNPGQRFAYRVADLPPPA